jgi:hypothetical protein
VLRNDKQKGKGSQKGKSNGKAKAKRQKQIPPFDLAQGRLFGDDNQKGKNKGKSKTAFSTSLIGGLNSI